MAVIDFIAESLFWAFVGAASLIVWLKASYSCVEAMGAFLCTPHSFDLMRAFM